MFKKVFECSEIICQMFGFFNIYFFLLYFDHCCGMWDLICGMWTLCHSRWDLVPWPGTEARPPALGAWSQPLNQQGNPELFQFSSVRLLSCGWLFTTPWTAACQAPCPSPTPGACSDSVHWVSDAIQPSHPSSCLQSSPASGSFPVSQFSLETTAIG